MYKHTYKFLFASTYGGTNHVFRLKASSPEMTGMQNLFLSTVAPTALGPISSCRASETNGKQPGENVCACPERWFCGYLLLHGPMVAPRNNSPKGSQKE